MLSFSCMEQIPFKFGDAVMMDNCDLPDIEWDVYDAFTDPVQ